ncbi:DUF6580 family putative transport protein [Candidatus Protochlamydia sp. R18]|uniref:DUF6580 family putative transport protein n=1 Tax=Candidatus Protochlamydia sp. R18 TaxID=1353977 RepID=UPI000A7F3E6C
MIDKIWSFPQYFLIIRCNRVYMDMSRFLTIFGLIFFGIATRVMPHPPCFTPLNAIILFSVYHYQNRSLTLFLLFSTLLFSDLVIGFYSTLPFVYFSFCLVIFIGQKLKEKMPLRYLFFISLLTSFLFFLITNFGVWTMGSLYPKTLAGLSTCYLAGIPFLRNQILGDLSYSFLLFGYVAYWKKNFSSQYALRNFQPN